MLIDADDDNVDNPAIQLPDTAAKQSLNNTHVLLGGFGNDILINLLGNDVLHGGPGHDILIGGPEVLACRTATSSSATSGTTSIFGRVETGAMPSGEG